jgi:hypothetical protein
MAQTRERPAVEVVRERLTAAIAALRDEDAYRDWLDTRAQFHSYSFRNTLLIWRQKPHATRVASYGAWRKLGYQVTRGSKGALIFVPIRRKVEDEETGEKRLRVVGFGKGYVFDVSDVEPIEGKAKPLSLPSEGVAGESHARYLPRLEALVGELGYGVERRAIQIADGFCDPRARVICLRAGMPANEQVQVLVHELAHALGITYEDYPRPTAEVMAEAAAYIVCTGLGLDVDRASVPYIAGWHDAAADEIEAHAEAIDAIARRIEQAAHDDEREAAAQALPVAA